MQFKGSLQTTTTTTTTTMSTIINNDNDNDLNNSSQPIQDASTQDASTPRTSDPDPASTATAVETGDVAVTAAVKDMTVTFVQDVSGSMEEQRRSVVNGINEIVGDLKKRYAAPCKHHATVCVIKFSSHDNIRIGPTMPVQDMPVMTVADLKCDGSTALWDAVAIAIARMNTDSAGVPATTYIFTDGDNNDSMRHTQSGVNEMIAENKKKNPMHSVLFIGSDPSTRRNADDMGLDRMHSIQHDSDSTPVAYEVCRRALGRCVSGDTQSTEFNESDIVLSETPSLRRTDDQAHSSWENVKSDAVGDSQPDSPPESDQFESDYAPSRTQSSRW
jgi:Mg-chelatase subunit ChlD